MKTLDPTFAPIATAADVKESRLNGRAKIELFLVDSVGCVVTMEDIFIAWHVVWATYLLYFV